MRPSASASRFQWLVIGPFLIAVALMAMLSIASTEIMSAVRAYVGGESLYSKGQKDAAYHLAKYAASRNPDDIRRFREALSIPLGDQKARTELERAKPDLAVVRQGFVEGGNHADDIASMIWLFQNFRQVSFMADAIDIWAEADRQILVLEALANQIEQRVVASRAGPAQTAASLAQLTLLNDLLTSIEQRFSARLGEASRIANFLVLVATVLLGLGLAATASLLSMRALRHQALAEAALRESQERLQRALEGSELALWDCDVESGRVYLSESWSRHLGGPNEVTQTTLTAFAELIPQSERAGVNNSLLAALKDPAADYRVEHRVRRLDGEWLWNRSEGRVVERAPDGRALRIAGVNRDITERKQAEAARHALEAQLRESQKMEAIGTLAGGIAHDFNNILGAIIGNVALAREHLGEHAAQANLKQINKAAMRARGLVQQILAFSRRQPPELRNQPLRPLVQESLALMRSTLPAGVVLDVELSDVPLHVHADATQMHQVLMNLCTNAWHALRGKSGRIGVGLEPVDLDAAAAQRPGGLPPGGYAHLWVSDDGCGMDVATLSRIFEPFYTTMPVGQGTGLGLSVVHGIVAAHHGVITVQSEPGRGTTFNLYFPLLELHAGAALPSGWGSLEMLESIGQGEHVLCIDDDEVMLPLVEQILRRLGYRVTCYQDPGEALAAVRLQPRDFDLVVSDFNMPQCSGLDVAREVARVRPDLPVVINSGYIDDALRADAMRAGVRGLIQKENTLEELGAMVQRLLRTDPDAP